MEKFLKENWIILGLIFLLLVCVGAYYALNTQTDVNSSLGTMAGMNMSGDPTKRYSANFTTIPSKILPGQTAELTFKIFDASNGTIVNDYLLTMEKMMHLVIVNSNLTYFDHIHPVWNGSEFSITTTFPEDNIYRLYISFQPGDGPEQQLAFSLPVGSGVSNATAIPPDESLSKKFGTTIVSLTTDDKTPFNAEAMTNMAQVINFHLTDATTNEPITDLKPYLGAFGHLILINEKTYQYIHIHPVVSEGELGGPDVKFLPMSLFGPIPPGIYRVFAQFNRNNSVFTSDFTIRLE